MRKQVENALLDDYFKLPSSPMKNSPVGKLMQAIVSESPEADFEFARSMARQSIVNASKRKHYRPMTPKQEEAGRLAARKAFRK